jgi:glyoxylase-like metal-dependent hydrolase (beta-lactamase superfamily II)
MTDPEASDDLYLEQLLCGSMQNFVYVVGSRRTREVALVDPAWAIDALLDHVQERGFEPVAALVTHYHQDHVGGEIFGHRIEGLSELLARKGMKVYANKHEADGLKQVTGLSESDLARVESGDKLRLGDVEIEFLHTPGHTPGSQCFMARNSLVSGDTLFIQGCGRVDLPGANPDDMFRSLQKLASLPGNTVLYPGHDYGGGPHLSLSETRRVNPYLRIPDLETWRELMG